MSLDTVARFVIADDQEQVDKVLEIQGKLPDLQEMIYIDPRGLRKYDHSKLHDFKRCRKQTLP